MAARRRHPSRRPRQPTTLPAVCLRRLPLLCGALLDPLPKAKKKCPGCGQPVYVRSGPDGLRHLLAESQLADHEEWWAHHPGRDRAAGLSPHAQYDAARPAPRSGPGIARRRLHARDRGNPLSPGSAGAAGGAGGSSRRARWPNCSASPRNEHDPNAIRVVTNEPTVACLERSEAADYRPLIEGLEAGCP